eukprot:3679696-Lingulodinium_polyedra.AAC.1
MSGWTDVLRDAGPACYPTSGTPSRIDRALVNRRAASGCRVTVGPRHCHARWDPAGFGRLIA